MERLVQEERLADAWGETKKGRNNEVRLSEFKDLIAEMRETVDAAVGVAQAQKGATGRPRSTTADLRRQIIQYNNWIDQEMKKGPRADPARVAALKKSIRRIKRQLVREALPVTPDTEG
jgi:hypothetical protein